MRKNSVSACSTDSGPAKKPRMYSVPVGYNPKYDYDIWCLGRGIQYQWGYTEYCAIYTMEFYTEEDLLAFKLSFKL